ncbi:MAG: AIR synthase related protein [Candidatus Thorarchaeota archaeon]
MKRLDEIVELLSNFEGISRKFVLPQIIKKLRTESYEGDSPHSLGEDSAAISTNGDEVILLTTDSILEDLCLNHPRAAGFNAVLANVMDIYAAGGTPTSFAIALSYSDEQIGQDLLSGLIEGSHAFRVPIVRGHTNPSSKSTYIVGSATGVVSKTELLTAGGALEGDILILLYDAEGKRGSSYSLGWDCVSGRSSDEIADRLSTMNELAKKKLIHASKDVSGAGLIGTAGMMVEYSGVGAEIDLNATMKSCPDSIGLEDWVRMFLSLGFLLAVSKKHESQIDAIAKSHGMVTVSVGTVDSSKMLRLKMDGNERVLFDFTKGPLLTPRG